MKTSPAHLIFQKIDSLRNQGLIPERYAEILRTFFSGYEQVLQPLTFSQHEELFLKFIDLVKQQCQDPFSFQLYHERIRSPLDHYQLGIDMLKPLVDLPACRIEGLEELDEIIASLERGENAIFLANHQTEADPHAISILLEKHAPKFAEEMIFVAGERVITDPLAIVFSMGRNLLCIYSKRYIDHPPEDKLKKQLHNKRTMELMSELLSEGGKAIYVAPSGGRDRPNKEGIVEISAYDPRSIEMLYLMAQRAGHPTHFYPLALKTSELLPPPETIQRELGEMRLAKHARIHMAFGPQIDMENYPGSDLPDKWERRTARAHSIWEWVCSQYALFP